MALLFLIEKQPWRIFLVRNEALPLISIFLA